jgi:hypothetical protein
MSTELQLNPVDYVRRLNQLRRTAAAALKDGEPFVYFTIRKPSPPTGRTIHLSDRSGPIGTIEQATPVPDSYWAVSARFRPAAVVLWCQQEAERLAKG